MGSILTGTAVLGVRVGIDGLTRCLRQQAEEPSRRHLRVPGVAAADVAGARVTSSDAVLDRRADIAERSAAEREPSQYRANLARAARWENVLRRTNCLGRSAGRSRRICC